MKKFIIRLDAGGTDGFGHAVRSIDLANTLRKYYGIDTYFYSNSNPLLEQMYVKNDFDFFVNEGLNEDEFLYKISFDNPNAVLFIDKLFPYKREEIIRLKNNLTIIMFHNVCEGMYESDYAIFPSANLSNEIINRISQQKTVANFLFGPEYVLINSDIINIIEFIKNKQEVSTPYIAVTTGASDPKGMLIKLLEWFNESRFDKKIVGLYGFDFKYSNKLNKMISCLKPSILVKKFNYNDLFSSRMVVSAFGVTTYELIYANIPVITIGHIQRNSTGGYILQERYGCNEHLGLFKDLTKDKFINSVQNIWNNNSIYRNIMVNQTNMIDGKGLYRVAEVIKKCC